VLAVRDGEVVTNSRDVADFFGKQHRNVLSDIDRLVKRGVLSFKHTPSVNIQNGQTYRSYEMDRDGFTLLAMSFTGDRALDFKLAYIQQFNAMNDQLRVTITMLKDHLGGTSGGIAHKIR
jgi:Rha family phage regulatory protein